MKPDSDFFSTSLSSQLIPAKYELMPNVADIFELEFALGEISFLSDEELINRSAFIAKVNGKESNHLKIGLASTQDIYNQKSIRTRSFFKKGRYSTGYAVHSLFPYRGKFHAQLIKAIINVIGLKPNDMLLDPMMGSGTACIEAQLMGINTIGFDRSPFCYLMALAKSQSITKRTNALERALDNPEVSRDYINNLNGNKEALEDFPSNRLIILLAYLDAMGYARRSAKKNIEVTFPEVLNRYFQTIQRFWNLQDEINLDIGMGTFDIADTRNLPIPDLSVDGIITSPPYSFAIDYIDNDLPQLEFLGIDTKELRNELMGLRGGRKKSDRIATYLEDLNLMLADMARVLKYGKYCVIIIGSNEIQTGGIRFEEEIIKLAPEHGLTLSKNMHKPIRGIQNSMTEEFVIFLRKMDN
jgi:DNA modification methylase